MGFNEFSRLFLKICLKEVRWVFSCWEKLMVQFIGHSISELIKMNANSKHVAWLWLVNFTWYHFLICNDRKLSIVAIELTHIFLCIILSKCICEVIITVSVEFWGYRRVTIMFWWCTIMFRFRVTIWHTAVCCLHTMMCTITMCGVRRADRVSVRTTRPWAVHTTSIKIGIS